MSLLLCDLCKNVLKEPIFIPCGYSICKYHVENESRQTECIFCKKIHQDPYVANQKLAHLIDLLNRAKSSTRELSSYANEYKHFKMKPAEYVNMFFKDIVCQVNEERDRIVKHVLSEIDRAHVACLDHVKEFQERCLNALEVKPTNQFLVEINEINTKLAKFDEFLKSNKISEDIWEEIIQQSKRLSDEVRLLQLKVN